MKPPIEHFPRAPAHPHIRSTSHTDVSQAKPIRTVGTQSASNSGTQTPVQRPPLSRAQSHPGPAPKSKPPRREFGVHRRVQRKPGSPGSHSPPNGYQPSQYSHTQPLNTHQVGSNVRDFAPTPSSAAHTVPTRKKPVYSLHEADPSVKGRPNVIYTDEDLLRRLNTIGEENDDDLVDRVKTVDQQKAREWEEQRLAKEQKEMNEWEKKERKKEQRAKLTRGWSWKGFGKAVGLADGGKN